MLFHSLKPAQQELVRLLQRLDFGVVEMTVRDGEPVMHPPPKITKTHKLGTYAGPRPECGLSDFELKRPVQELFEETSKMDLCTLRVEVQNGLPFRISYEVGV